MDVYSVTAGLSGLENAEKSSSKVCGVIPVKLSLFPPGVAKHKKQCMSMSIFTCYYYTSKIIMNRGGGNSGETERMQNL